ncbi:MAG: flagellar hook protein FlgE [Gammaproteobacteria bacterium]|nr:MAG: flagellar hook protein FlgE [Gammaproteobacteria bacterium]
MPFRTALSGLIASGADLRIIGNNVANASTTGFKKSRSEFADVYAVSNLGAASDAIGTGVRLADVAQQFTQGNIEFTDNNLDLAISGQGFFRLSDNGSIIYSRAGAFQVDRSGYVVNSNNQRLTAFQADATGNITGAIGDLRLDTSDIAPNATGNIEIGINLDSEASIVPVATIFDPTDPNSFNNSTSLTIYDSLGNEHLGTFYYRKTAANNWNSYLFVDGQEIYGNAAPPYTADGLQFDANGNLTVPVGGSITYPAFNTGSGAANLNLTVDYSGGTPATQYGGNFSVNALTQDGYATGRLNGVDIDSTGVVLSRYTNGQSRVLGQVAMANFSNPQGLQQLGDTSWAESFASGSALVGAPGTSSLGLVQSGALEGSNVDLTEQLVNMITAQRNFQANAQVITTADTITQTIINIR